MTKKKEYYCFRIEVDINDTEKELNRLADLGWKLICSYAKNGCYLIMERDKETCPKCGNGIK